MGQWLSAVATLRETGEVVADVALLRASEEHRQGELRLHRIFGCLDARNDASARVLEKLGMRREAHLVESEWIKGEWQSEIVYALLADEFRAGTRGPAGRDRPAGPD